MCMRSLLLQQHCSSEWTSLSTYIFCNTLALPNIQIHLSGQIRAEAEILLAKIKYCLHLKKPVGFKQYRFKQCKRLERKGLQYVKWWDGIKESRIGKTKRRLIQNRSVDFKGKKKMLLSMSQNRIPENIYICPSLHLTTASLDLTFISQSKIRAINC